MRGEYEVTIQSRRLQYRFKIKRNITILRGDSATGKTTLINMISSYEQSRDKSGVNISCERPCRVLSAQNWQNNLEQIHESIVFIDEGSSFTKTVEFASLIKKTDNYYVIVSRDNHSNLPYSVNEIYGIKNTTKKSFQGAKRLYSTFKPLGIDSRSADNKPKIIIVEDSNSGYEFFKHVCESFGMTCISAKGKTKIYDCALKRLNEPIMVIADGAAFGSEIERIEQLSRIRNVGYYLPESFEWLILNSGLFKGEKVDKVLKGPADYIDSKKYFSWEQYFVYLLVEVTKNTYLKYSKRKINEEYLEPKIVKKILTNVPKSLFKK